MITREVEPALLRRHLGLPAGADVDDQTRQRIDAAGDWYSQRGDPWVHSSVLDIVAITSDCVKLDNRVELSSRVLADGFRQVAAEKMAIVAATAGQRVDDEIDNLWKTDRPDDAMFLAAYACAVVEQIREQEIERLRGEVAQQGLSLLPHYCPGYDGWGLEDQRVLFAALTQRGLIELLPSCCLKPVRSMLAAVGVTRKQEVGGLNDFWFFDRASPQAQLRNPTEHYAFPERTLMKWSRDRLKIKQVDECSVSARFRFDGTTCSSMGMPLAIEYNVELRREQNGQYRIMNGSCEPCKGDTGHRDTCAYRSAPERFMTTIAAERPFQNQSLDDVMSWQPDVNPAGCLCLKSNRDHKWRIVLQTIHFALANGEYEPRINTDETRITLQ